MRHTEYECANLSGEGSGSVAKSNCGLRSFSDYHDIGAEQKDHLENILSHFATFGTGGRSNRIEGARERDHIAGHVGV